MGIFDKFFKPNIKEMKRKRDFEGLIKALWHGGSDIRYEAARTLAKIKVSEKIKEIKDKRAVDPFILALEDNDRLVRWGATKVLGERG